MFRFGASHNFLGDMANQFFHQGSAIFSKIGIGPVSSSMVNSGYVFRENPLIPEIAIQFENLVESPTSKRLR